VLELRTKTLGAGHQDTLDVMENLGVVLFNHGKFEPAEKLLQQVVELRKKTLGAEHADTIRTMNSYANMLNEQTKPGPSGEKKR
jgi:hypothetical protein